MKKEKRNIPSPQHSTLRPARRQASRALSIICLCGTLLSACERVIDYNGPEQQPMLVVNVTCHPGESAAVNVSHSVFFLDMAAGMENLTLSDAKVSLSVNGEAAILSYDPAARNYPDPRILHEGDEVSVLVTHPTYGKATATTVVPQATDIRTTLRTSEFNGYRQDSIDSERNYYGLYACRTDSVWRISLALDKAEDTKYYRLTVNPSYTFRLSEGPGTMLLYFSYTELEPNDDGSYTVTANNYYTIPATTKYTLGLNETGDLSDIIDFDSFSSDNPFFYTPSTFIFSSDNLVGDGENLLAFDILLQTPEWEGGNYYFYHPDEHYISNKYGYLYYENEDGYSEAGEELNAVDYGNPWDIVGRNISYSVDITLETLTPDYYYYIKSVEKYQNSSWSPFSEPVQVTCNVDGGIGVLGASSFRTTSVQRTYTFSE